MGLIKNFFKETSTKILNKIGAQRSSHQLVLNETSSIISPTSAKVLAHLSGQNQVAATTITSIGRRGKRKVVFNNDNKRDKKFKKNKKVIEGSELAISEALLMAAKNNLPPVQFHHIHGQNALLSRNKFIARRTQSFCQALVFSNRVILPNERVYIKVLEIAKGWSGTIRFGFTSIDPATLRYQMPKHACPDMTSAGHTWARALADEVVKKNSVIHFSYNSNGYIYYGINNQDCGIFYANVNTSKHLWFIVDIYGLTAAVELIDPRININYNYNSSTSDLSRIGVDDDENLISSSTERFRRRLNRQHHHHHLSSLDDNFYTQENIYGISASRNKKLRRARKKAERQGGLLADRQLRADENGNLFSTNPLTTAATTARFNHLNQTDLQARNMLPNLNSIILPSAQQNIYTPMPSILNNNNNNNRNHLNMNDSHDYYQIMSTYGSQQQQQANESYHSIASTRSSLATDSTSNHNNSSALNSTLLATSASSSSPVTAAAAAAVSNPSTISHVQEITKQLDCFKINGRISDNKNKQLIASGSSSGGGSNSNKHSKQTVPIPASRKLRQQQIQMTNFKQTSESIYNQNQKITHSNNKINNSSSLSGTVAPILSSSSTKIKNNNSSSIVNANSSSSNIVRPKVRQSLKKSQPINRDINENSSSQSKDCPICFERPINCVLYQCGHMCTCYECGVKQWKTQSRTCPICRTVIKDVIKTYMS